MKKSRTIAASCLLVLYLAAYGVLRSNHFITHYSNEDHWVPEKRSPGHFVNTRSDRKISDKVAKVLFWPVMKAEEAMHGLRG